MTEQSSSGEAEAGTEAGTERWLRDWGQYLRLARQIAGFSLGELSARSGLSKGYLSKLESGHESARNPSRTTLAALARALPNFRPLALMLEPGALNPGAEYTPGTPRGTRYDSASDPDDEPLVDPARIGWRELELLVALLALERAAIPMPLTTVILARAVDRPLAAVHQALDELVTSRVLQRVPPRLPGGLPSYRSASDVANRLGLDRLGDALVLAAALLAHRPSGAPRAEIASE